MSVPINFMCFGKRIHDLDVGKVPAHGSTKRPPGAQNLQTSMESSDAGEKDVYVAEIVVSRTSSIGQYTNIVVVIIWNSYLPRLRTINLMRFRF